MCIHEHISDLFLQNTGLLYGHKGQLGHICESLTGSSIILEPLLKYNQYIRSHQIYFIIF